MPATEDDVRRWMKQLRLRPEVLVWGSLAQAETDLLARLGCIARSLSPNAVQGELYRRMQRAELVILSPSLTDEIVQNFVARFGWKLHARWAPGVHARDDNLSWLLDALDRLVGEWPTPPGGEASRKSSVQAGHHAPNGFYELCNSVCLLDAVTRLRFWEYAGRDMLVEVDSRDEVAPRQVRETEEHKIRATRRLRIRTLDRAGVIVDIRCDHPRHVERVRTQLQGLLERHIGR